MASNGEDPSETTVGQSDSSGELISREFFAMDTYMTLSTYGEGAEDALAQAEAAITDLENEVSTEVETSSIARLNASGSAVLSGDSLTLVDAALKLYQETGGAFNISVYPIMQTWGFVSGDYQVPDDKTIRKLLENTDLTMVDFDRDSGKISFKQDGMGIDLGGITKGLASAKAVGILKDAGLKGGMVNLGGNVQTFGVKPDGSQWRIAVNSPYEEEDYLGIIETTDKAVITSGGYERFFEEDGVRYHHIIDPSTGYPADSGVLSATIVASDGCLADGLSTALFVMGTDKASSLWRESGEEFDFILMDSDNTLHITEGIAESFTSDKYDVKIVRK